MVELKQHLTLTLPLTLRLTLTLTKVVELKQHLASRGLGVSGRKDVLVARLEAAIITAQTEVMSLQVRALTPTLTPTPTLASPSPNPDPNTNPNPNQLVVVPAAAHRW